MESVDDVLLETEEKMEKSLRVLHEQFSGLRTGKASPALVEGVHVSYYGATVRLRELANITTPEPRLIVISPYDPSSLGAIEKALLAANIGLTPMNDGRVIRISVPELTQERRVELTKVARRMAEECRVAMRNERRDANDKLRRLQKEGQISEDDRDRALAEVQKLTDTYIAKVDDLVKGKEKEILTV